VKGGIPRSNKIRWHANRAAGAERQRHATEIRNSATPSR
jgi:hypothetical protein